MHAHGTLMASMHEPSSRWPGNVLAAVAAAVGSIVFAPLLHAVSPLLAIAVEALVAVATVAAAPAYAPLIAAFILLFQNLFVSILSPYIASPSDLEFIKGYNFLGCSVMWLTTVGLYMLGMRHCSPEVDRLMRWGMGVLAVVMFYFAIGVTQNAMSAAIYLRNIALPLFLFQLSLLTAATYKVRVTPTLLTIGIALIVCGYVELVFRDFWLDITNGHAFWHFDEIKATDSGIWEREMRITGSVIVDLKDRFTFNFLNTPLLEGFGLSDILRVFGPNMSAISFGYGVAFFTLFLFAIGYPLVAIATLPLLVLCSVKGASILVLFVCFAWISTRLFGAAKTLVIVLLGLVVYVGAGIYIGLQIGDYHVIGFMGGWNGFIQNPFGRGLGVGGNFSEGFSSIDWSAAQHAGSVDGAVESAVGVLLYQMGIAALVPLAFYAVIAMKAWRLYGSSGIPTQGLAAFGVAVVMVNGVFQEEALFAPPALGLFLCLAGLVLGNAVRTQHANGLSVNECLADGAGHEKSE
jgi:hypothetical protein